MKALFLAFANFVALQTLMASDTVPDAAREQEPSSDVVSIVQGDPRYEELLELTRQARENPGPHGRRKGFLGSSHRPNEGTQEN